MRNWWWASAMLDGAAKQMGGKTSIIIRTGVICRLLKWVEFEMRYNIHLTVDYLSDLRNFKENGHVLKRWIVGLVLY